MSLDIDKYKEEAFKYIDNIKDMLSSDIWSDILMDCSKNDLFVLWFLYRNKYANMTQIAEYISAPLNTVTGIINCMEKKKLVVRERSAEDRRVVSISLGEQGIAQIELIIKELTGYVLAAVNEFSEEEIELLIKVVKKLPDIMQSYNRKKTEVKKVRRISIT